MNKIIEQQFKKVQFADLSNFNKDSNTYFIKKRVDIKIDEDKCYLLHLKPTAFTNQTVTVNWNNGSIPKSEYIKADISRCMGKMIKVVSVSYDNVSNSDSGIFWSGWLNLDDIEVINCIN